MKIEEQEQAFADAIRYYESLKGPKGQDVLVELLYEVQEIYGFIPSSKVAEVERAIGMKEAVIRKLIQLYPSLKSADYRHRIVVCTGNNCGNAAAAQVLSAVRKEAEKRGNTVFEVVTRGCLKQCRTAPNMMVDGDLHTGVRPEAVPGILKKYPD